MPRSHTLAHHEENGDSDEDHLRWKDPTCLYNSSVGTNLYSSTRNRTQISNSSQSPSHLVYRAKRRYSSSESITASEIPVSANIQEVPFFPVTPPPASPGATHFDQAKRARGTRAPLYPQSTEAKASTQSQSPKESTTGPTSGPIDMPVPLFSHPQPQFWAETPQNLSRPTSAMRRAMFKHDSAHGLLNQSEASWPRPMVRHPDMVQSPDAVDENTTSTWRSILSPLTQAVKSIFTSTTPKSYIEDRPYFREFVPYLKGAHKSASEPAITYEEFTRLDRVKERHSGDISSDASLIPKTEGDSATRRSKPGWFSRKKEEIRQHFDSMFSFPSSRGARLAETDSCSGSVNSRDEGSSSIWGYGTEEPNQRKDWRRPLSISRGDERQRYKSQGDSPVDSPVSPLASFDSLLRPRYSKVSSMQDLASPSQNGAQRRNSDHTLADDDRMTLLSPPVTHHGLPYQLRNLSNSWFTSAMSKFKQVMTGYGSLSKPASLSKAKYNWGSTLQQSPKRSRKSKCRRPRKSMDGLYESLADRRSWWNSRLHSQSFASRVYGQRRSSGRWRGLFSRVTGEIRANATQLVGRLSFPYGLRPKSNIESRSVTCEDISRVSRSGGRPALHSRNETSWLGSWLRGKPLQPIDQAHLDKIRAQQEALQTCLSALSNEEPQLSTAMKHLTTTNLNSKGHLKTTILDSKAFTGLWNLRKKRNLRDLENVGCWLSRQQTELEYYQTMKSGESPERIREFYGIPSPIDITGNGSWIDPEEFQKIIYR